MCHEAKRPLTWRTLAPIYRSFPPELIAADIVATHDTLVDDEAGLA